MDHPSSARSLVILPLLAAFLSAPAAAQHAPEFVPRRGERRLSYNIFKASHNSYDRNETYVGQIDDYNCWCLELDCLWKDGTLRVAHACPETSTLLSTALDRIGDSILAPYKVTVIWLEWKAICDGNPTSTQVHDELAGAVNAFLGLNSVYRPTDFLAPQGDAARWPSWQELVRRGKPWIIVAEGWPIDESPYFFKSLCTGCTEPLLPPTDSRAFYNNHENNSAPPFSDHWISRGYPDPLCGETGGPGYETQAEWNNGVTEPFNLVATNCIANRHTQADDRVHPPMPCFVLRNDSGRANEYGTHLDPFWGLGVNGGGLLGAVNRVRTYGDLSEIWVQAGDYDFPGAVVIDGPCVITNWTGGGSAVVIR